MIRRSLFLALALALMSSRAWSICNTGSGMINPVTDINWTEVFPIKIGGLTIVRSDQPPVPDSTESPICICNGIPGIKVSFWDPFTIMEAVHDPWCFPTLGLNLAKSKSARLTGTVSDASGKESYGGYFAQVHYIHFPVWRILNLLTHMSCVAGGKFDIADMTEIEPWWQDDLQSIFLSPEALVFGNPVLQAACMADAVASTAKLPLDPLFWCMGQWGSVYPFSGHLMTSNPVMGAAGLAAREIYRLNREGIMCDRNVGVCSCFYTPIWIKSHYRLQILRPRVNKGSLIRIGEPSPIWGFFQSPLSLKGQDNFGFLVFRKVTCCLQYTP